MAMPRPRGKALKIAEDTIPGLKSALSGQKFPKSYGSRGGDVEEKVMRTNNQLGKEFRRIIR